MKRELEKQRYEFDFLKGAMLKMSDLNEYAKKAELNEYAKKAALNDYKKKTDVTQSSVVANAQGMGQADLEQLILSVLDSSGLIAG